MGVQDQKKLIRATREAVPAFLLIEVLNALVRNDQDLKNIALALCKPKGDDESIEALI